MRESQQQSGLTRCQFLGPYMPEFIERDVRALRGTSSSERTILLVGAKGDRDELKEKIESINGEVFDYIGRSTLRVSLPKSQVDSLCEIETIVSIERDKDDVYPQNQGNL